MQKKEFGRYSPSDLRALSDLARTLEPQLRELRVSMAADPALLEEHLAPPFYWANFYQIPFFDLVGAQIVLLGLAAQFSELAKESDPLAAIYQALPDFEPESDAEPKLIMGVLMALQGNVRSISFYSKSLEELTSEVAQGNDDAFFDAVLIDRTILACPPFADRMALAEYLRDDKFFKKLAQRLSKGIPSKRTKAYTPLRICLWVLEQEKCLDSLSETRAFELFCRELDLYPEDPKGDTSGSLNRFVRRWKKERRT
jgi:hypothetical protein